MVPVTAVVVAVLLTSLILGYGWHRDRLNLTREITRLGGRQ